MGLIWLFTLKAYNVQFIETTDYMIIKGCTRVWKQNNVLNLPRNIYSVVSTYSFL